MVFQTRQFCGWACLAAMLVGLSAVSADAAPELRIDMPERAPRVGEAFEVRAVVSWQGPSEQFRVVPGALEAPSWGEGTWDRVEAEQDGDHTALTFVARFVSREPGEVRVPELRLVYSDPTEKPISPPPTPSPTGEAEALPAVSPTHTLSAESFTLGVRADYRWLYPYAFLVVMLIGAVIAGGSVFMRRRKEEAVRRHREALAPWQTAEAALHNARRHRLDGDFYSFYRELLRLVQHVGGEVKAEFAEKLQKMVERVGYQGYKPNDDDIEGVLKDIERALARWKEGKAA